MTDFKNIVLTTDLSSNSDAAIPFAAALAKRDGGTIHLVHAFENDSRDALTAGVVIGSSAWLHSIHAQREKDVAALSAAIATQYGVKVNHATLTGNAAIEVTKFAQRGRADVIVVSTHGRTGLTHLVLGSVAERILRLSPVPVLTVRPSEKPFDCNSKFKSVLMPTDFSDSSAAAKSYAAALAKKDGATLAIVHVIDDSVFYTTLEPGFYMADSQEWMESLRADAEKRLSDIGRVISGKTGVKCDLINARGRAAEQICAIAKERQADLIVISTHGYTGLSHLVFGSVAEKVIRTSTIPVLSIKPKTITEQE